MKSKLKTGVLVTVLVLDIMLLNINLSTNRYKGERGIQSTANHIEVVEESEVPSVSGELETVTAQETEIIKEPIVENELIVYDNLTLNELSAKLNKSLNSTISNQGYLIASYSLEKGVDPYLATAIILQETGCKWECSYIVKACNNVGGQVGSGCGNYSYFNTLDEGIKGFIDNLYKNFVSVGLVTADQMNPKYAADPTWSVNVNKYIENIKAQ